jgi:hypothetical protein
MRLRLVVPPNLDHRKVTETSTFLRRPPYEVVTQLNNTVYKIQHHPRTEMTVLHKDRMAPYLGAIQDEQP